MSHIYAAVLVALLSSGVAGLAQDAGFTLHGRITLDRPAAVVEVALQDPRLKNAEVARVRADETGNYELRGLMERSYRLVTFVDGKKQSRKDVEILCPSGASVTKDFHYGKVNPTLMLYFPAEDPDVIELDEYQGIRSRELRREYDKAVQDQIHGKPARALERLKAIAEEAPEFYGVHARLGLLYQQAGCYFAAEPEYVRATELSPRSAPPLLNLASNRLRAADVPGHREEMVNRAMESLRRALEIRPESSIAYCLMGAAQQKIRAFEEAEKSFKQALTLDERNEAASLMLADLYLRQKNWAGGIRQLRMYLAGHHASANRSIVQSMIAEAETQLKENPRPALPSDDSR